MEWYHAWNIILIFLYLYMCYARQGLGERAEKIRELGFGDLCSIVQCAKMGRKPTTVLTIKAQSIPYWFLPNFYLFSCMIRVFLCRKKQLLLKCHQKFRNFPRSSICSEISKNSIECTFSKLTVKYILEYSLMKH